MGIAEAGGGHDFATEEDIGRALAAIRRLSCSPRVATLLRELVAALLYLLVASPPCDERSRVVECLAELCGTAAAEPLRKAPRLGGCEDADEICPQCRVTRIVVQEALNMLRHCQRSLCPRLTANGTRGIAAARGLQEDGLVQVALVLNSASAALHPPCFWAAQRQSNDFAAEGGVNAPSADLGWSWLLLEIAHLAASPGSWKPLLVEPALAYTISSTQATVEELERAGRVAMRPPSPPPEAASWRRLGLWHGR